MYTDAHLYMTSYWYTCGCFYLSIYISIYIWRCESTRRTLARRSRRLRARARALAHNRARTGMHPTGARMHPYMGAFLCS